MSEPMLEQEIHEQLQAQALQLEQLTGELARVRRIIFWLQFWGFVRVIMITIPIILALVYLPPVIRQLLDTLAPVWPTLSAALL